MSTPCDFWVRRDDYSQTRFVEPAADAHALDDGQALLRIDHFALTANNVTYAAAGDMLNYWSFFPADEGWGRIPVWGFADVVASRCPDLAEGGRYYGYYPMSTHLRVAPVRVSETGFFDGSEHRQAMAATYNQYRDVAADPGYRADGEAAQMLLHPLFTTGFLIDDALGDAAFHGAEAVVISSASSKTGFALAFQLAQRGSVRVIGLTSPGNRSFTEGLGCYDQVCTYPEISSLDASVPTAYVDMAGNGSITGEVHRHFGAQLRHSLVVGMTHWKEGQRPEGMPGPEPEFFFAPTQVQKRHQDWGAAGLQERVGKAFLAFQGLSDRALQVVRGGRGDLDRVYHELLEGRTAPDVGHVLGLHEGE
ncbi:MAG: DUF2855 family protein [Myxococcota bacterium]